jgi:RHS repeat-associated protein
LTETATPEWTNIYEYHCGDLVGSITRGAEKVAYSYDGNLLTGIAQSGTLTGSLGFSYNNDFQLTSFTYAGAIAEFGYDKDGLLITSGGFTIGRNSDNGLPETVADNSFTLSRIFNDHGEVDGVGIDVGGAAFSYDLTRDTTGRIKTKTETITGVDSLFTYTYDPLGRLRTVNKDGNLVEEYRYDNNGNRSYQMNAYLNITDRTFSHSLEDHSLTAGPVTYEFDYDDNLSARIEEGETTAYSYSTTGELQRVTLPDTTVISYVHDPLGRIIAKKINGSTVEKYLWSGRTTLLAVYDGHNNLLQRFEYADGRMPFAMTAGGAVYYLAYDQVGSLRLITDSGGNTVKRIDYDSFGNILTDSNENFTIPFGFAGGLHDRDTGLVRFGYRDYLPEIGKWTAKDPILFAGGDANLYGYVANDPVNWVDPEGLTFSSDYTANLKTTNSFFFKGSTKVSRTVLGIGTSGHMAQKIGGVTLGQALKATFTNPGLSGIRGSATLGGLSGTWGAFLVNSVANGAVGALFLEGGIGFGSLVNAFPVFGTDQNVGEWWVEAIWNYYHKDCP